MSSEFKSGIGADFRQRELGLIPHDQPGGPLPRNLGAFCGQIAPMVSVLPVVPVRKYCAVYYLAHDSYHGMEEVIGSIPIRSTKYFNGLADLRIPRILPPHKFQPKAASSAAAEMLMAPRNFACAVSCGNRASLN